MKLNQINAIKERIEEFENSGFEEDIIEYYSEDQSMIGSYSPAEFVATIKRLIKQLKNELEDEESAKYLPYQYNYANEYGNGNLQSDLQNLLTNLQQSQYPNSIGLVRRLVYYQIVNGFWDKTKRKYHKANEIKLSEANDRILFLEEKLNTITKELLIERNSFDEYVQEQKEELAEVSAQLVEAKETVMQIVTLKEASTENQEAIESILESQRDELSKTKDKLADENELIENARREIEAFKSEVERKITEFTEKNDDFVEKLDFVESKRKFFEDRLKYLEELIGREVGASLFETFKQRKNELNFSVNFWKYAVPVMTVAIIVWIYFLFNGIEPKSTDPETAKVVINWEEYIVNTLKLVPAVILLFFTIRQYRKERDFQEEYAFKSAVALTIDAYSKKITSPEKRDEMIISSVGSIFQTPIKTKQGRESLKSKSMLEGIEAVKDTVGDVAKSLLDITKKIE